MSRDGGDVGVNLGSEDVAHALQDVLDIARTNVKAPVEETAREGSHVARLTKDRKGATHGLGQRDPLFPGRGRGPGRGAGDGAPIVGGIARGSRGHAGSVGVSQARIEIRGTWDGGELEGHERAVFEVCVDRAAGRLALVVEASYHGDPAPKAPPGPLDGLWEYEVVELFLLGSEQRYLEIELGPHGHHLGLRLEGRRRVVERDIGIELRTRRLGRHWRGEASLDLEWLPPGLHAANAYAMHGRGPDRRFLAAHPVPGPEPDFHRLECFAPLSLE